MCSGCHHVVTRNRRNWRITSCEVLQQFDRGKGRYQYTPERASSSIDSSSANEPCSIDLTPARTAVRMLAGSSAAAAAGRPRSRAASTMAAISAGVGHLLGQLRFENRSRHDDLDDIRPFRDHASRRPGTIRRPVARRLQIGVLEVPLDVAAQPQTVDDAAARGHNRPAGGHDSWTLNDPALDRLTQAEHHVRITRKVAYSRKSRQQCAPRLRIRAKDDDTVLGGCKIAAVVVPAKLEMDAPIDQAGHHERFGSSMTVAPAARTKPGSIDRIRPSSITIDCSGRGATPGSTSSMPAWMIVGGAAAPDGLAARNVAMTAHHFGQRIIGLNGRGSGNSPEVRLSVAAR